MLLTALLGLPSPPPVRLEVVMVPKNPKVGDMVEANLIIRNISKKPTAIARTETWGGMSAGAGMKFFLDGKEIYVSGGETSNPAVQTIFTNEVTSRTFEYLQPGQYTNVYWVKFNAYYDPQLVSARVTKADYAKPIATTPLRAGSFTVKGFYTFSKSTKTGFKNFQQTYEFTPSAKKLFDMSFGGTLNATSKFTVTP